ncbi:MAG: aminoacyl-tRNA hydrolase [Patescibacteria group bacterium]|jgi:PTH1 family peptidyl-tRNA hydrolase
MKIIIGLGNPGAEYVGTRHNVGFDFIDKLIQHPRLAPVDKEMIFVKSKKFQAKIAETNIAGEKYILVKPQTFMNQSGKTVRGLMDFYKASPEDILIISDDLDLSLGMSRTRLSGSSGGHNGLNSIISEIGTDEFKRLRVGISNKIIGGTESGHPYEKSEAKKFVLERFSKREQPIINKMIQKSVDIIVDCLTGKETFSATTFEA